MRSRQLLANPSDQDENMRSKQLFWESLDEDKDDDKSSRQLFWEWSDEDTRPRQLFSKSLDEEDDIPELSSFASDDHRLADSLEDAL